MKDDGYFEDTWVGEKALYNVREEDLGTERKRIPDISDEPKLASDFNPGDISQIDWRLLAAQRNHCARPARRAHGKGTRHKGV